MDNYYAALLTLIIIVIFVLIGSFLQHQSSKSTGMLIDFYSTLGNAFSSAAGLLLLAFIGLLLPKFIRKSLQNFQKYDI
jgi:hypothetical protein